MFKRLFGRRRFAPAWEYRTDWRIWRVVAAGEFVVVEERETGRKETRYACLRHRDGRVQWRELKFDERWWIGIEAVEEGVLLLHGFASPDMPEHQGVIAVEISSGRTLWEEKERRFETVSGSSLFTVRQTLSGVVITEVNLLTGAQLQETSDASVLVARNDRAQPMREWMQFPQPLDLIRSADGNAVALVNSYAARHGDVVPSELLATNGIVICTLVRRTREDYDIVIVAIERDSGDVLFESVVDVTTDPQSMKESSTPPITQDMFFCTEGMLFFLRDRHTLVAVSLS